MAKDDIVRNLNILLRELEDGKTGFSEASQECESPELATLLKECAEDCARAVHPLQQAVQSYGESAVRSGSAAGSVRKGWIKLKASVVADSTLTAINEAEHEHQRLEDAFNAVLDDAELPPAIRTVVAQEQAVVKRNLGRLGSARRHYEETVKV
jgi:uncharacterized protein (TIGR02284 family)